MNSSTNPPNVQTKRFSFDLDFEEERLRLEAIRQEELIRQAQSLEQSPQEEVIIPTYSDEQLTQAREESFQIGYEQGITDAKKSIEKLTAELIERIVMKLRTLIDAEAKRDLLMQEVALTSVMATIKKTWPQVMQKLGVQTVEDTIRQALDLNKQEPRIVVRVHDTLLDSIVSRLPHLQEQEAFAGKVIVLSDDSVMAGDCKVEWADGGLERLSRTLSQQLDHAFGHILADISNSNNENVEPERTSS